MNDTLVTLIGAAIALVLYFVPSIEAIYKKHEKAGWIFLLNLLAGWTLLGWGVAYVWADEVGVPEVAPRAEEKARTRAA